MKMEQFSLSCLSRAKTADEITKAMRVYEAIRKPRAVKLKNASEEIGLKSIIQTARSNESEMRR